MRGFASWMMVASLSLGGCALGRVAFGGDGDDGGDVDADVDGDVDGDTDGDTDTGSETESESDTDTGGDVDADSDGDTDGDAACERQCDIATDCPEVISLDTDACWDTCRSALDGECEIMCSGGGTTDIADCMETLNAQIEYADSVYCTDEFITEWCDVYYNYVECLPILLEWGGLFASEAGVCFGCGFGCWYDADGECNDGGPDSISADCELGSDCRDCGPRDL